MRSFKLFVCFEWVIYEQYINSDHHTQLGILLSVPYLATNLYDPVIFVLL